MEYDYWWNESYDFLKMQSSKQKSNFWLAVYAETFCVCKTFLENIGIGAIGNTAVPLLNFFT